MAIFGDSKKKGEKKEGKARVARQAKFLGGKEHEIIKAPWLSEKAILQTEKGVYAFEVPPSATKQEVAGAVKALYKVDARQVRIVNLPAKRKNLRSRRGTGARSARSKAYVYLKQGDTIQFA